MIIANDSSSYVPCMRDWRFALADHPGAEQTAFNDDDWRVLDLPHDYSIEGDYEESHPGGRRQGFLPSGVAWYRKTFTWQESDRGVEFICDGAAMHARVYCNGVLMGERPNPYAPQLYDLTAVLKPGENCIAIRVDTSQAPYDRWYTGSGLYRSCFLRYRSPLSFVHDGTFVRWTDIQEARYQITSEIINHSSDVKQGYLRCFIDEELIAMQEFSVDAESVKLCEISGVFPDPIHWSVEYPHLYTLRLEITDGQEVTDQLIHNTGIRQLDWRPDGLRLNGRPLLIQGVCLHHDAGGIGAAVPASVWRGRLRTLKDMGCNAIRTGHTPFPTEVYTLCDELGIMVMNELFDGWHKKAAFDYGAVAFDDWWQRDVAAVMRRDRNHASVIMWGIGNETGEEDKHQITEYCHQFDPDRPCSGGQLIHGVDIPGFNGPAGVPGYLEQWHQEHPQQGVLLTEKPHTYQTRSFYRSQTWWRDLGNPRFDIPDICDEEVFDEDYAPSHPHILCYNSSYDNAAVRMSARRSWQRTRDLDFVYGEFRWTGIDYLGESFGWPFRSGNNGIIDLAGFKKDIYYFYQSQWTQAPMVHLLPHWSWHGKEGHSIPVWAYSNAEEVELFVNGRSLGRRTMGRDQDEMKAEWHVVYEPGILHAVAYRDGVVVAETKRQTNKGFHHLRVLKQQDLVYDVQQLCEIEVTARDYAQCLDERANNQLAILLDGPAQLKGFENGDPACLSAHWEDAYPLFAGMAKAYVAATAASGAVTACVLSICGQRRFLQQQQVQIRAVPLSLRGEQEIAAPTIRYAINKGVTDSSPVYTDGIIINESCTVHARVYWAGQSIDITETFTCADLIRVDPNAIVHDKPLSQALIGRWGNKTTGAELELKSDGSAVLQFAQGQPMACTWWYSEPIDAIEAQFSDDDHGRLVLNWHDYALQHLDGRLRLRRVNFEGDEAIYLEPLRQDELVPLVE